MGILRLYLALCVVAAHSNSVFPWEQHDGTQAVQIFYIISGFYMELISSKYKSKLEFYASRFLRIFIPYWIILAIVLIVSSSSGFLFDKWLMLDPYFANPLEKNSLWEVVLVAATNITLFFQDWVVTFMLDQHEFRVIPQAWTIGIELTFYLLVPLLHKLNNRYLIGVCLISISARILSYQFLDLQHSPWDHRFFPFELSLFILGMLGCRMRSLLPERIIKFNPKRSTGYIFSSFILLTLFFISLKGTNALITLIGYHYATLISYVAWACLIPVFFQVFSKSRQDRIIGELSYPVYLVHVLVIRLVWPIFTRLKISEAPLGEISAIITVFVTVLLYRYVFSPIESRRYAAAARISKRL